MYANVLIAGTYIFNKFLATVHCAGSGEPNENGFSQLSYGFRSELPSVYGTRPTYYSGKRAQRDDVFKIAHYKLRYFSCSGSAVTVERAFP